MHEDGAAEALGHGCAHHGVPGEAADIVDDFDPGLDGVTGDRGFVGVDGENGAGALFFDGLDDGQDAVELLLGGDGSGQGGSVAGRGGCAGAGGFSANVEDVGALVEQFEAVGGSGFGIEIEASVGKGIGRDVEHAHDEGALAERQRAAARVPIGSGGAWQGDCSRNRRGGGGQGRGKQAGCGRRKTLLSAAFCRRRTDCR